MINTIHYQKLLSKTTKDEGNRQKNSTFGLDTNNVLTKKKKTGKGAPYPPPRIIGSSHKF